MNRRSFLTAAGGGLAALRPSSLETLEAATQSRAGRSAEDIARDEDFWFEVRNEFTIDRNHINLNSGSVSPHRAACKRR